MQNLWKIVELEGTTWRPYVKFTPRSKCLLHKKNDDKKAKGRAEKDSLGIKKHF
jgi:hypothetical protein